MLGGVLGSLVERWRRRVLRTDNCCRRGAPLLFETVEVHRLTSSEGLKYKLMVSLPLHYHTPEASGTRYPVVYALDAEPYLFPLLATAARTEHFFKRTSWYPDLIVVGLVADLEDDFRHPYPGSSLEVRALWDALRPTRARDWVADKESHLNFHSMDIEKITRHLIDTNLIWLFPNIRGPSLAVLIIRNIVYWGPFWAPDSWKLPSKFFDSNPGDYLPTAAESPWGAPGAVPLKDVSGHATTFVRFLASQVALPISWGDPLTVISLGTLFIFIII